MLTRGIGRMIIVVEYKGNICLVVVLARDSLPRNLANVYVTQGNAVRRCRC